MNNYFPLIEFNISHDYYTNGMCTALELGIAGNEKRISNNYKLSFRKLKPWKYIVYVELDEHFEERINVLEREIKEDPNFLSFFLKIKDNKFSTITKDVSFSLGKEFVRLPIDINQDNKEQSYKINNYQKVIAGNQFENDLLKEHAGFFAFLTLNIKGDSGNFLTSQIKSNKPIIVSIDFEGKSVYWKYILLPRTNKSNDLIINEIKQQVEFSEIKWSDNNNQKSGITFSKNEIKLSENYPFIIQLWKNYTNGRSLVLNKLSFPNPENPANFSQKENEENYISIYQYY